jgi:hypothetical protein
MLLLAGTGVQAADWVLVSQISNNVREVDKSSIRGQKPLLEFISRHVIDDADEMKVGRQSVKYLVMEQRIDCEKRTILLASSEAQGANGVTIAKQRLFAQEATAVLDGSVDEDVLKYVCAQ